MLFKTESGHRKFLPENNYNNIIIIIIIIILFLIFIFFQYNPFNWPGSNFQC